MRYEYSQCGDNEHAKQMDGVFQHSFRVFPPLFGTAAGRPPCVFSVFFFCPRLATRSSSGRRLPLGLSPMTAHLSPRRGGQTGRCPPCRLWQKGELTWGVFTLSSREVEAGEDWTERGRGGGGWDRRGGRGVLWGHFSWREKRRGRGTQGTGLWIYAIGISIHQMLVIALAHMLQTLLYVTNYFTQPGGLYLIMPVSLFRESLVIRLNDSDFQGKRQLFCPVERVWGTGKKRKRKTA